MALDKERIKESLSLNEIKLILHKLGSNDPIPDKNGNMMFQTVCHNRCNGKHKLYYYEESRMFHCYTECNENFDIYEVVIRAKREQGHELSFYESVQYVSSVTGKIYTSSVLDKAASHIIDDWNFINRYKRKEKIKPELPVYDDRVMNVFLPYPHEEWINEGISYETQMKFNICYYQRDDRIVIPHFDSENNLVGIRGRSLRQEDIVNGKKYIPLTIENKLYNHPTMFNLYGLNKTKEAISRIKKCVIFEGEKSVLKCEDYYGEDNFTVAVGGSNISNYQRDLLLQLGVEEVFIGFDKQFEDPESIIAEKYAKTLLKLAKKFSPYVRTYILWDELHLLGLKESPADKGREALETLMKSKYEINTIDEEVIA